MPDAAETKDNQGRKIIAAQDFVNAEGIQTVFGIGGGYLGQNNFIVFIVFLNEAIEKSVAEKFMLVINDFKTNTIGSIRDKKIFAA